MKDLITSLQNPLVKRMVRLREASHRKRQGRFLIEGQRELQRAIAKGWPLETIVLCPELLNPGWMDTVIGQSLEPSAEIIHFSLEAFQKASQRENPDGAIGIAHRRMPDLHQIQPGPHSLFLVSAGIEKPGNQGNMFRTANAAGCDAILLADPHSDPFSPQVIRASQGAFFDLPFAVTSESECIRWLQKNGIQIIATSPAGNISLWDADLSIPTALVMGPEDSGLGPDWFDSPFVRTVALPMKGVSDSLNVASTAAIAVFEAVRQRRLKANGKEVR